METRKCADCGLERDLSDYYRRTDGSPLAACKVCHRARVRRTRLKDPALHRARCRSYYRRTQYRPTKPEGASSAHWRVREAIQRGDLVPGPCGLSHDPNHECEGGIEAHHEDYSKPLSVIWLCKGHHRRYHYLLRQAEMKGWEWRLIYF